MSGRFPNLAFRVQTATAGPKAIDEFERRHGFRLPADYREFLLECDGGEPITDALVGVSAAEGLVGIREFLSIASDDIARIDDALETFGLRLPPGTVPIADCEGGN